MLHERYFDIAFSLALTVNYPVIVIFFVLLHCDALSLIYTQFSSRQHSLTNI